MKPRPSSSSSVLRNIFLSLFLFTLIPFILFILILYGENISVSIGKQLDLGSCRSVPKIEKKRVKLPFAVGETEQGCDVFSGRWVRDESTRPLYEESDCPYIQPQLMCQ